MFASGVRWESAQNLTSSIALVESDNVSESKGETCVTSLTDYLSANDSDYTANGTKYFGSSTGLGGQRIDQLNKGNIIYNRLTARIQAAYDLSNTAGRSFNFYNLFWTQVEADYVAGTQPDVYKTALIGLQNDLSIDTKEITGQTFKIPFIMYQSSSHRRQGVDYPGLVLGMTELCNAQQDMHMANAMYNFDYDASDNLHLTADAYFMLGQYYGSAAKQLKDNGKVELCEIKNIVKQGRIIEVQINTPVPPLVIDTTRVTAAVNSGFDIYSLSNGGIYDIITSVVLSGVDRVKITTSADIPSDAILYYAIGRPGDPSVTSRVNGPRGNIRDSRGDTFNWTNSASQTDRADNYLLISAVEI
tara:strand:- start:59 stop:1138 length:1080 start_codon:yes stop_codon:yes gene_type:complete